MTLDDFLADVPEAPTEPVTFSIVWPTKDSAMPGKREVKASLAFVDGYALADALKAAAEPTTARYGRTSPPPDAEQDERIYQILLVALRSADDPRKAFCRDINKLRKALVPRVAGNLYAAYMKFAEREFPAAVTDADFQKMKEDAKGE